LLGLGDLKIFVGFLEEVADGGDCYRWVPFGAERVVTEGVVEHGQCLIDDLFGLELVGAWAQDISAHEDEIDDEIEGCSHVDPEIVERQDVSL